MKEFNYNVGGCLHSDAPSYVHRNVDYELYKDLKTGICCLITAPRQMGKSSLIRSTMQKLQYEDIRCCYIDLMGFGPINITEEEWYFSIAQVIINQVKPSFDLNSFWSENSFYSSSRKFIEIIDIVLLDISNPLVIFIDEIDILIELKFKNDFLGLIRYCHENFNKYNKDKKVTFVLSGMFFNSDLILNPNSSPFNIGKKIKLDNFKLNEITPLAAGLKEKVNDPIRVLEEVLNWTGGQPFLTQALCQLVIEHLFYINLGEEGNTIRHLVQEYVLDNLGNNDCFSMNLTPIRNQILSSGQSTEILLLYQQILEKGEIELLNDNFYQKKLLLSGLLLEDKNKLKIGNRIYEFIFNLEWVKKELKERFNENNYILQELILQPGQKLYGDRYTIIKAQQDRTELGSGGFGITYLARDNQGREVVIKTLNERAQTSPKFAKIQQDFRDEATRLGYCKHPHIVQIENKFDVGQLPCIVLEYIKGETLWNLVDNHGNPVALPEEEALLYIRQIGEALIVVHGKGLLHRDVNPNNIILRADRSEAVLIDFGISKEYIPDLTQQYTVEFTECFAPLEQYDKNGKHGNYTDVYALAATMFYLLTGKYPTPATNRVINDDFIPQKLATLNISDKVKYALIKGLELKITDRPDSVDEWLRLLEGLENKNQKIVRQIRRINFVQMWAFISVGLTVSISLSITTSKIEIPSPIPTIMPTFIPVQTIFQCVQKQKNWAIITKRGNAISSSPIITFNSTEFGAWTLQKRCSTVAQSLTKIVAENERGLDNLYLTTGKVNAYTVVCLLKQNQSSCHLENILFTINQDVKDPKEILEMITNFSRLSNSSNTVIETSNLPQFIPLKALVERSFMSQ